METGNMLQDAIKASEDMTCREWSLKGTLYNIHGAYEKRTMTLKRGARSKRNKQRLHDEQEGEQAAQLETRGNTEIQKQFEDEIEIHTFPQDKDGGFQIPLGGTRGYLAGALKSAARNFGTQRGQKYFGILTLIERGGIAITPQWISTDNKPLLQPIEYPTTMAGGRMAQVIYFDAIPEVPFELTVTEFSQTKVIETKESARTKHQEREQPFTNALLKEDEFLALLGAIHKKIPIGPKGRGTIEFTVITRIK